MLLTAVELEGWLTRIARDPYGTPLGTIAKVVRDEETKAPEWLIVSPANDGHGVLVPVLGAVPTGQQVRVIASAEQVRTAPAVEVGEELAPATGRSAAEHYGLLLDSDRSSSGLPRVSRPEGRAGDDRPPARSREPSSEHREQIIAGLRAAHAMEQAALKQLAAMRWRDRDEELVHDLALHHKQTRDHAERLRVRLDELDASRARPLDWLGKLLAYMRAQIPRMRSQPEPVDLRTVEDLEKAEIAAYERLERIAAEAGDERTAALCRANRDDEVAMAQTLAAHRLWADPAVPEGRPSPFAAPEDLAEVAPKS